jgi:acyl-homoserine lactone acylase PvdQ
MQDENGSEAKALVADANKIEYTHHGPTVASQYNRGYAITISPHEMVITIKSYSKILLTVKRLLHQMSLIKYLLLLKM